MQSEAAQFPLIADLGKPVPGHAATAGEMGATSASSKSAAVPDPIHGSGEVTVDTSATPTKQLRFQRLNAEPTVSDIGGFKRVGDTGLQVAGAKPSNGADDAQPRSTAIRVLDRAAASKHHLSGIVLSLRRTDRQTATGTVALKVPKAVLASTFGADFADRVRFVELPADASTGEHATAVPMTTSGDSVVATPKVTTRTMLLAATSSATSSSGTGSFAATSLKGASSWDVSAQTGDFSWQYPLAAPPAAAGPAPDLALSYDSQAVDGETGSTNNQPSAVGDGWDLAGGGFIERQYVSCAQDDGASGAVSTSGDLCWKTDNATLSLGGHSEPLVRDSATGVWKLLSDDGSRIEHLTGTGQGCAANGTYDTDCWRVTTTDGALYFFGLNQLPGWSSGKPTTNSAWTVPVYGNDAGEPCHAGTFAASSCIQAWRWNLDYVVDVHNNAEAFYYNAETNSYGQNGRGASSYVRGGQLEHIDYGLTASSVYATNAASDRVSFGYDAYGRCSDASHASCTKEPASGSAVKPATATAYPDVPFDQLCTASCTANPVPTFWTDAMLNTVVTSVRTSSTAYSTVDTWTLSHAFPAPGDGTNAALWLTQVQHTGTAGTSTLSEPPTKFAGTTMQNRVWAVDGLAPLDKWRIASITDATGAVTSVNYSGQDCQPSEAATIEANAATNTRRCFPQWWTPQVTPAVAPKLDLFHKYVVTSVVADPKTGGGADRPEITSYLYTGTAGWRYNTSPFVPEKNRTWSVFAGYNTVEVRDGAPATPAADKTTDYTFYQGLDGDRSSTSGGTKSISVTGTPGVPDSPWLAGSVRETKTLNGVGGSVTDDIVNTPWTSAPVANDGMTTARMAGDGDTIETQPVSSGSSRTIHTTTTHNDAGFPATVNVTTSDAGSTCTTTTYAPDNSTAWIRGLEQEHVEVAAACGTTPVLPRDAISDTRTSYDGNAFGATPTKGDATAAQKVDSYSGATAHWTTTATTTYDGLGRVLSNTDALGRATTTAYTPAAAGPLTKTVTTNPAPFNWTDTTTIDPARGAALSETAVDGGVTTASYDPLGRRTAVWLPERPQSANASSPSISYTYVESQTAPMSVATTKVMSHSPNTSYVLYDGLGRTVQTQTASPSTGTLVSDTQYDAAGNVSTTNNPYWTTSVNPSGTLFVPESQQQIGSSIENHYDGAGRQTAAIMNSLGKERFRTTTSYRGSDEVDVTPPSGGTPTSTWTNSLGQKTRLVQYLAATPDPSATQQATTYGYDPRGNLTSTADPAGNTWTWNYDLFGNKTTSVDPDTGTTTATYDLAGRQLTSTDARGQTLAYTYDNLDRKLAEYSGNTSGPELASWNYDTLDKGQLTSASSYVGSTPGKPGDAYTRTISGYDAGNEPTGTTITTPASAPGFGSMSYTVNYSYNQDESLNTESHPAIGGLAAEKIGYSYDGVGNTIGVSGTASYASAIYTALGQLAQVNRNGNLTSASAYGYDAATGAVTEIKDLTGVGTGASTVQADRNYSRNDAGDITAAAVTGATGTETQCYSYDQLQELTQAWTPSSGNCATTPSKTALGGPAPYWNNYTYDTETGNRLSVAKHGVNSAADETVNYTYPNAGAAHPHGVTTVTSSATADVDSYGYDATGSTVSRPNGTLTYDAAERISTVNVGSSTQSDIYDADGTLLLQSDPTVGSTLFLGNTEIRKAPSGAVTATRTYSIGKTPVAERTTNSGSNKVFGLALDVDGTSDLEIGASDKSINRRWTDPFGADRGAAAVWSSAHGFLNKSESALTGLVQLGARAYDSSLGRFLSVDPVFSANNPQQDNGYSYSANNPITNADPSGECYLAIGGGGNCGGGVEHSNPNAPTGRSPGAPKVSRGRSTYVPPGVDVKRNVSKAVKAAAAAHSGCSYSNGVWCSPAAVPKKTTKEQQTDLVNELLWQRAMRQSTGSGVSGWLMARDRDVAEWEHDHEGAIAGTAGLYAGALDTTSTPKAATDETAKWPVGRQGRGDKILAARNSPGTVDGINYSGHAFDQMRLRGFTPSVIKEAIEYGTVVGDEDPTVITFTSQDRVSVVYNWNTGTVITVMKTGG